MRQCNHESQKHLISRFVALFDKSYQQVWKADRLEAFFVKGEEKKVYFSFFFFLKSFYDGAKIG